MSGYSGTPLTKKLGIKDGFRVALLDMPADVKAQLTDAFATCAISKGARGALDFIMLFTKSQRDLRAKLPPSASALAPTGMLWVSWPKKTSGVDTDLNENIVREVGLSAGLVDVKVCAVTNIWSGLKFVIPVKNRPKN